MATLIQAITRYRPRLVVRRTIGLDTLAVRMAHGTLVSGPIARLVLDTLSEELTNALRAGEAVRLPGIGRFALELRADGTVRPVLRMAQSLRYAVGDLGAYRGEVRNAHHVGMTAAEMAALWNAEHPNDPVAVVGERQGVSDDVTGVGEGLAPGRLGTAAKARVNAG